ncbi:MAG: type II secretion system protein GspJ [Candidatus Binataceae bacterium]
MKHRLYAHSRGFTLIEIMLAVMILALVLVMLAGSFSAVAHSKVQFQNRLTIDHEGRAILWTISNELRDAVQTPNILSNVVLIGTGRMGNGASIDSLSVSTLDLSHSPSLDGFGAEQLVTYSSAPNPDHPGYFMLMRRERSALVPQPPANSRRIVLASNVLSLHVRYFNGTRWLETWNSAEQTPGQQLPQAVSIDLQLADQHGRPADFATRVTLPMAFPQW